MKKLSFYLLVLTMLLVSFMTEARSSKEYDVYLLIGQSNMAGRGQMTAEDRQPIEGVYLLDRDGNIVPACAPLNIYSTVRKKPGVQKFSLGYAFAQEMAKKSRRKILLVVQARGGTGIRLWLKDAERVKYDEKHGDEPELWGQEMPQFFSETVRRTKQALRYGRLKGILWHQGEGDSGEKTAALYVDRLCSFVADLRDSIGVTSKVPFVCGEVCREYARAMNINLELNRAAKLIPNAHCVSSEGCPAKSDKVHFSREGCLILGKRYAECF